MRYLSTYKLYEKKKPIKEINRRRKWINSKVDDIIDCSYDLIDLPYKFDYSKWTDGSFVSYDRIHNRCEISYIGSIPDEENCFCSGSHDSVFKYDLLEIDYDRIVSDVDDFINGKHLDKISSRAHLYRKNFDVRCERVLKVVRDLLNGVDEILPRLKSEIFNDGFKNSVDFHIHIYPFVSGSRVVVKLNFYFED